MNETTPERPRADLRPMGIGDVFDATFDLYRRNFVRLLGAVAIVRVPTACIGFAVSTRLLAISEELEAFGDQPPPEAASMLLGMLLSVLALAGLMFFVEAVIVAPILYGGLTWAAARRWLLMPARLFQAFGRALRRWLALTGASILVALLVVAGATAIMFLVILIAKVTGFALGTGIVGILVIVALVVVFAGPPAVVLGLVASRLALFFPAVMVEGHSAFGALGRAWRLTRGAAWRTLGVLLVGIMIKGFLVGGPTAALTLIAQTTGRFTPEQALVIQSFADVIASLLFDPILFTAVAIHFFDLKVRKEAYDLELAARHRFSETTAAATGAKT